MSLPSQVRPAPSPLLTAAGLALGAAVALGFGRFSYALLLPPMRASLAWSYTQAGAMNTANGLGYLLGAVLAPFALTRWGARPAFLVAMLVTALGIACTAISGQFAFLIALRLLTGLGGAVTFTAGGLLAAQASPKLNSEASPRVSQPARQPPLPSTASSGGSARPVSRMPRLAPA